MATKSSVALSCLCVRLSVSPIYVWLLARRQIKGTLPRRPNSSTGDFGRRTRLSGPKIRLLRKSWQVVLRCAQQYGRSSINTREQRANSEKLEVRVESLASFCFQTTATSPFLVSTPSTLSRHRRAPILNLSQNDAKAKLKKTGQENMDLQRRSNQLECAHRVLEARARAAPTVASLATPAAFTSTASGRSVTKQSWSRKGSACLTLSVKIDSVGWQHCIRTCSCSVTCAPKTGSPYTSKHKDECRRATRIVAKGTVPSAFFPLVGRPSTIHRKTVVEWLSRLV